jgi:hypothetical protein
VWREALLAAVWSFIFLFFASSLPILIRASLSLASLERRARLNWRFGRPSVLLWADIGATFLPGRF